MKVIGPLGEEEEIEAENLDPPFAEEIQESLRKGEVIAACDASVKDGIMGAYWVIMTRKNEKLLSHKCMQKTGVTTPPKPLKQ